VASAREIRQFGQAESFRSALAFSPDGRTLVAGGKEPSIHLYEVATGKLRATLESHQGSLWFAGFSPNGKILVTGGSNNTTVVWDLPGLLQVDARQLSTRTLESFWSDLSSMDAAKPYRAIWSLASTPERAVELLRARLKPVVAADAKKTASLIGALDSAHYGRRNKAAEELRMQEDAVKPALRAAVERSPTSRCAGASNKS
jgi:hypothetical protein